MTLSSFNPLTIFNDLRDNGMPEPEAQAVVRGYQETRSGLATSGEVEALRAQMLLMQAELEKTIWRGVAIICSLVLAATGVLIGAIAAFGS